VTVSTRSGARRRAAAQGWPWLVPVALAAFVYETNGAYVPKALAALAAFALVALAARRPDRSLLVLVAGLPFQGLVLAQLYRWGVPGAIVRPLGSWKEALGLGVVIAGVRGYHAGRQRLDALDGLGLAYVAIVGAYALAPTFFAPGAPIDTSTRSLAFRASAGFVILLLAARHAHLPDDFADRLARVVMVVGCIVAAVCLYEYFFSAAWNRWVVEKVQYLRYQVQVLHTTPFSAGDIRRYSVIGGHRVLRTGSVFLDPTSCGFALVLPFAVAIERRMRTAMSGAIAAIVLIATGLLLTETRAALLGALVVALLAIRPAAGRTVDRRLQYTFVLLAGMAIIVPAATAIGLAQRVTATSTSADPSSVDHAHSFWTGLDAVETRPLGHGLGTSAGVGQRSDSRQATIGESSYLQVGIETGAGAMAVFVALTLAVTGRLRRLSRRTSDVAISAAFGAGVGLALGAFFLQTWNDFSVAWTFWALAGAAIGAAERSLSRSDRLRSRSSVASDVS
jgi:hypothetical protein